MKQFLITIMCVFFTAGTVFAQSDLQPAAIVRLNGTEPITVKQLRTQVETLERTNGRTLTAAERREVLDLMIDQKLIQQAAARDRVTLSDAEVNNYMQQQRAMLSQMLGRQATDQDFANAIREQTGVDMATFNTEIRKQLLSQKYITQKKASIFQAVTEPTEQEITAAYNLNKTQPPFIRPDTVRVSMVSIPIGNDRTRARALADRLVSEIGSDAAKFDEAVIKAQAPNSGYQAGDAGYLPRNPEAQQLVGADFLNTAFSLRQGEVSRVVESRGAYQIIKVTETYSQKNLELTDIIQLGTRVTVREYIQNALTQEKLAAAEQRAIQEVRTELRQGNPFQVIESALNW